MSLGNMGLKTFPLDVTYEALQYEHVQQNLHQNS